VKPSKESKKKDEKKPNVSEESSQPGGARTDEGSGGGFGHEKIHQSGCFLDQKTKRTRAEVWVQVEQKCYRSSLRSESG